MLICFQCKTTCNIVCRKIKEKTFKHKNRIIKIQDTKRSVRKFPSEFPHNSWTKGGTLSHCKKDSFIHSYVHSLTSAS